MYSLQGQKGVDRDASFWAKIDKKTRSECWPWLASTNIDGYGQFWVGTTFVGAHRYSWELSRKCKVPYGKMILHLCDNRICCNPSHLYCGDAKQNAQDRMDRSQKVPAHITANPKLYAGEIWLIRELKIPIKSNYKNGRYKFPQSLVAKMFRVDQSLISLIWKSDKWLSKEGTYV